MLVEAQGRPVAAVQVRPSVDVHAAACPSWPERGVAPTTTNRSGPAAIDANDAPAAPGMSETAVQEPPAACDPEAHEASDETGRNRRDGGDDTTAKHGPNPSLGHWTMRPMTIWPDIIALFGSDRMLST